MRFGYGLITCQRPPTDRRTDAELYADVIDRCVAAEQAGFNSVWLSEHHFVDDGYMPSLLVLAAAIARATQRVEIGTAVLLAPLHHPLRIAEDAATVDVISGGRLILGLGAGWREEEFDVFGVGLKERASRMRETVKVLRGAWSEEGFEYAGAQVNVTPKPAHPIPIWIGGFSPPAIARAGRIADGFLGSSTGTSGIEAFARAKHIALDARREAGGSRDFAFALHVPAYASENDDPWDEIKTHYQYLRWKYPDMGAARGSAKAGTPPPLDQEIEEQLRPTIMCGSPEDVAAQVRRYADALGNDIHFIFRADFPGMPQAQQLELIDTIGTKVIGSLREGRPGGRSGRS